MKRVSLLVMLYATFAPTVQLYACANAVLLFRGWPAHSVVYYEFNQDIEESQRGCIADGMERWADTNHVTIALDTFLTTSNLTIHMAQDPNPGLYAEYLPLAEDPQMRVTAGELVIHPGWSLLSSCRQFANVAAHEMGHSFGLGHADGRTFADSLMAGSSSPQQLDSYDFSPTPCDIDRAGMAHDMIGPNWWPSQGLDSCTEAGIDGTRDWRGCCLPNLLLTVATPTNILPYGHIVGPLNNSVFPVGWSGQYELDSMDMDGSVTRVDWYVNGFYNQTSFSYPFSASYSNAAAGTYVVKALLYDNGGGTVWTDTVTATVGNYCARDTLQSNDKLYPGWTLVSANSAYYLTFQSDGNLVLYNAANQAITWSGTFGDPAFVHMQPSGNLAVNLFPTNPQIAWQTFTAGNAGAGLRVLTNGKVAIVRPNGAVVWQAP